MQQEQQRESFSFTGQGGEYFRIWIVNLLLSIVTLGIYSAWAKVRRLQYFYRHTSVAGASLDFHGDPIAILKGRIVAAVLFGSYSLLINFEPVAGFAVLAVIFAVMPWLLVRSFRFKLHNTSYRGLRFGFHGGTGDAYVYFLLLPLASYLTAGFIWPLAHQQMTRYIRNNSSFGNGRFGFDGKPGAFYKPYLVLFGIVIATVLAAIAIGVFLAKGSPALGSMAGNKDAIVVMTVIAVGLVYAALLLFAIPFLTSRLQNVIWNHTSLGSIGFESQLRARDLFGILFVNLLLIVLTLGLFKPFADIRMARYRIERLSLLTTTDLDAFVAERQAETSAAGEEVADFFDLDIAT